MSADVQWVTPFETPELLDDEVHIWRASLEMDSAALRRFERVLADDERIRAERLIFDRDRNRFIAARVILRDVLGRYLQRPPHTIDFIYGPRGKPAIASVGERQSVYFNLSHAHGLALIGITRRGEIGIDVELIRPDFASEEIAKRYFSPKEIDRLNEIPEERRTEAFFLCWTRKEAYIKAKGDGLHIPLDSFDVSLSPGEPAELFSADESRWGIETFVPSIVPEQRYAAAIVAEGKDWTARYFEWKE
jgi:4'-phosphopantetheinyl transferase